MRLFIAIELTDGMRCALTELQAQMFRRNVRGNYTSEENLHLTLAFIGEYGDPSRVLDALQPVAIPSFPLRLEGYGSFGPLWWAGLEASPALEACVRKLRRALAEAEIPFDRKRFLPHITLLRKANVQKMPGLTIPSVGMTADCISLMRSERGKHGMIYTAVGTLPIASEVH